MRAVADTGAVMLALPEDVVERLGGQEVGDIACTHAYGRQGERPIADPLTFTSATAGRTPVTPSSRGRRPAGPGQLVMEELDLIADRATRTLGRRPESPDRPLLRL